MTKPRTKVYFGKVCAKHPELKGERHAGSRDCTKCTRERQRAYYEKNKEGKRTYREKNKEKVAEYQRAYYEKNKEMYAERSLAWHHKNKEKVAKRKRARYSSMTPEQREINLARMRAYKLEREHNA